jgi:probable phosphoglycerate mutase
MPPPKVIIIARHAESEHHIRRLTGGWTDTPLTEAGHEQSRLLASRLARELDGHPVTLYSSDLLRASQTAEHIASALGTAMRLDERLREHNNGAAAGLTIEEAKARWPGSWGVAGDLDARPYDGAESPREFYDRAGAFIDEIEDDGTVPVVVSHGGTVVCLVARWLLLPAEVLNPIGFSAHTTAISVLSQDSNGRRLDVLNDTAHLYGRDGSVTIGDIVAARR